jgi:hypothetical protein
VNRGNPPRKLSHKGYELNDETFLR